MADQTHVQVGDEVEVIPSERSDCIGVFYNVGARGRVRSIESDGVLWVDFYPIGKPPPRGHGIWFIGPEQVRVIKLEADIYARADKLEGRLALAEAQRDQLLEACKTAYAALDRDGDEWGLCDMLRAAIANATGA